MDGKIYGSRLVRKTPLRNKKPWRPKRTTEIKRTPLQQVSKAQKTRLALYYPKQRAFLEIHRVCEICLARNRRPAASTEIHHKFGRSGKLLIDPRGFIASCRGCREFPQLNPEEARRIGVLGAASLWNIPIDKH